MIRVRELCLKASLFATLLVYTQGDSDVISSYHIYASCVGQALRNVCYCDITTDIFLNQLIQFYSNNAINLQSSLNFTQHAVLPHNTEMVL